MCNLHNSFVRSDPLRPHQTPLELFRPLLSPSDALRLLLPPQTPTDPSDLLRLPQTPSDPFRPPQTPSDSSDFLRPRQTPSCSLRPSQTPSDPVRPPQLITRILCILSVFFTPVVKPFAFYAAPLGLRAESRLAAIRMLKALNRRQAFDDSRA